MVGGARGISFRWIRGTARDLQQIRQMKLGEQGDKNIKRLSKQSAMAAALSLMIALFINEMIEQQVATAFGRREDGEST